MSGRLVKLLALSAALVLGGQTAFAATGSPALPRNEAEWRTYFRELARAKDAPTIFILATYYAAGHPQLAGKPDPEEALKHYLKAAELGHPEAQYRVGFCYEHKIGLRRANLEIAHKWYVKAADQEVPAAQLRVGEMYFYKQGVPFDERLAFHYLSKAAERGLPEAQRLLGDCYKLGWGTPRDYVKALTWYIIASAQEDQSAERNRQTVIEYYRITKEEQATAESAAKEFRPKP